MRTTARRVRKMPAAGAAGPHLVEQRAGGDVGAIVTGDSLVARGCVVGLGGHQVASLALPRSSAAVAKFATPAGARASAGGRAGPGNEQRLHRKTRVQSVLAARDLLVALGVQRHV